MDPGIILDYNAHGSMVQSSWVEGAPERSFWEGLKLKGHEKLAVTTYRCTGCGYLESYAR